MVSPELLEILRCPETMQRVRVATAEELAHFSAIAMAAGAKLPLEGGLVREDGKVLYPILKGIPVMLLEEAIRIG